MLLIVLWVMKMNDIIRELEFLRDRYKIPNFESKKNDFIAYIIHLKYLCDSKQKDYEEIITSREILIELNPLQKRRLDMFLPSKLYLNGILSVVKDKDTKQLLLEFLDYVGKSIGLHNDTDKLLYIRWYGDMYSYYNTKGNATYLIDNHIKSNNELLKTFDKILGINNKYIETKNIEKLSNYDYVYIYDDMPRYLMHKYNIYDDIYAYIKNNKNVVLYTNYSKISNFSDGRIIYRYIKTIIIDKTKTVMLFTNTDNNEISIINYDNINDPDKLQKIIKNNRKQKDVLTKTTHEELKENNLRIGFKLYQLEKNNEIRDINKIVDENTIYLSTLNSINERVEKEINSLLNK